MFVVALLLRAALVKRVTGGLDQEWPVTVPAYAIGTTANLRLFDRFTALA